MNARLLPCASCSRHIRADESACPFCHASVPLGFGAFEAEASARSSKAGRPLSRAAVLFVGASVAAACGGVESTSQTGGSADAQADGDQGDAAGQIDAHQRDGEDDHAVIALYGPAIIDAGEDGEGGNVHEGGGVPIYGSAVIDSGKGGKG